MGREKGAELSARDGYSSRHMECGAEGTTSSNFGVCAAACGDWRSAPARLCEAETISTRAPIVPPCEGVREADCPRSDETGAEASSGARGSGSRRGPTLSETQSEASTPSISKTRAADNLFMAASLAISIEMKGTRKRMFEASGAPAQNFTAFEVLSCVQSLTENSRGCQRKNY